MHQLTQRLALRQPAVLSEFHLAQAVPVVLNLSGIEQPIRAYLSANPPAAELMYKEVLAASAGLPASAMAGRFKRLFCFLRASDVTASRRERQLPQKPKGAS